jgi:hypothetical protein
VGGDDGDPDGAGLGASQGGGMMPNINDLLPSRYLKAHDLKGSSPIVTVASVMVEPTGRSREKKPVVYFVGKTKGLLLNKTNADALAAAAGSPMTEQWIGLKVRLVATTATFGSQTFDVVRIQPALTVAPGTRSGVAS